MSVIPLSSIEWHDLPVSEIRITEKGVSLFVTPYNEVSDSYGSLVLRICDAEMLNITLLGVLSAQDLSALEVSAFDYSVEPSGRITGTLRSLPGQAGLWEVSFAGARWELAVG